MKKLVYQLKSLCQNNGEGSFSTQKKRQQVLMLAARQLTSELGFHNMQDKSLKPKHVQALLNLWRSQDISVATLKSRMSHLRWWAYKMNKPNVMARTNDHYGIENRRFVTDESKAITIDDDTIAAIKDDYVRLSVKFAKAFGLRKEEAIKIHPLVADKGDRLFLQASWCKGRRERTIPIRTDEQRKIIDEAKRMAGSGSLIPAQLKYFQQRNRYETITAELGLKKLHGLRHHYAQMRYRELTGWECPHRGGPKRRIMSEQQKIVDREARLIVSQDLGHNRIEIVATYIG